MPKDIAVLRAIVARPVASLVWGLCLSISPLAGVGAAAAQGGTETYTFAFRDADLVQASREVLSVVGLPYTIDPTVSGRITFRIEQRLTRDQLLAAFAAVLESNGVALVRNGDQLTVTPQAKAKSSAGIRRQGEGTATSGYEMVAVPLAYAEPSEVAKALEAISETKSVVYTNDRLGLLVLGGSGGELKAVSEAIKIFDQNAFADTRIRWFDLSQAQAVTVASELDRIIQGAKLVGVSVVPMKRLNGLIVFARSTETLGEIGKWIARLDTPGKEASSSLWLYRPRATSAEALARTLNGVLGFQSSAELSATPSADGPRAGATPSTPSTTITQNASTPGEDQARIGVDKDTNTLIVFAAPGRWVQIQRILAEIDRTPRQVLIEASILEVTLSKDFRFGVDWNVMSGDFQASSINNGSGSVGPSVPGLSITFLKNDIEAAVSAIGARTAVEVVSAPKIIALDGKTAHLQIGDQVPVVTQSAQSRDNSNAALVNTVDYRSTGVILTVTPRVTGDDQLVLEVSQEVSSVARTVTSGIDSPTIQQRRFESALVVPDGRVVALGGLISTTRDTGNSGVPWLKDVPGVGALFSSRSRNSGRSELIVLLKARIIRDLASSEAVMADLFSDMRELEVRGLLPAKR